MKNIIKSIAISLLVFSFAACYDDKGSYDHIQSNVLSVSTYNKNPELYKKTVYIGEEVVYEPAITWRNPEADTLDYDYAWVFFDQDTISTERCLRYMPTEVGTFNGIYVIKERKTGIMTATQVSFTVKTPYAYGWTILSEIDGRTAVTLSTFTKTSYYYDDEDPEMIDYDNGDRTADGAVYWNYNLYKYKDFVDVYTQLHGDQLGKKPIGIDMNWVAYKTNYGEVIVLQEEGGNWVLDGNNFGKYYRLEEDFGSEMPEDFQPVWFFYCQGGHFIANKEGRLFWRSMAQNISRLMPFNDEVYWGANARITKFLEPPMWMTTKCFFAYDEGNNKIYTVSAGVNGTTRGGIGQIMTTKYTGSIPDGFVTFENLGDYTPMFVSNINALYNEQTSLLYLFLEKDGKVFIQKCKFAQLGVYSLQTSFENGQAVISEMEAPIELPLSGELTANSIFYKPNYQNSDLLLVGEGNNLYYTNMSTLERGFKLWKTFPAKIKAIHNAPDSQSMGVVLENGEFHIVFTNDYFFLEENGAEKATFHILKNLGNIVDVVYKSNSYYGSVIGFVTT